MTSTYHATHYEPTVDELATLKQMEMGVSMDLHEAHRHHLSARLHEQGLIHKDAAGAWSITASGRQLIQRQGN